MKLGEEEKVKREAAEVRERASKSRGLVGGAEPQPQPHEPGSNLGPIPLHFSNWSIFHPFNNNICI